MASATLLKTDRPCCCMVMAMQPTIVTGRDSRHWRR
jgi:hypothetical protein